MSTVTRLPCLVDIKLFAHKLFNTFGMKMKNQKKNLKNKNTKLINKENDPSSNPIALVTSYTTREYDN